jgi:hypothetical protein
MRATFVVLALLLPLASCGGSSSSGTESAATSLQVNMKPDKNGPVRAHTVTCPGDAVCDQLDALPASAFKPVPAGIMCSQIYGGPEEATVQGTLHGQPIDAQFSRTDGCETARWAKVQFLLEG